MASEEQTAGEEQFYDSLNAPVEESSHEATTLGGTGGEERVEEEEEDDGIDYTPLGSDDPEAARKYKEYKRLVKEIECQNDIVERLKAQIYELKCREKPCPSKEEQKELKNLHECLDQEMKKSNTLRQKAIKLQNFGSKRHYKEINLVTTFDEENMAPIPYTCNTMQVQSSQRATTRTEPGINWRASGGDTTSEMDNICSCPACNTNDGNEEEQLMKEIISALKTCAGEKKRSSPCDTCKSQQKGHHPKKSDSIEKIRQKMCRMEESMNKLKQELARKKAGSHGGHGGQQKSPCAKELPASCIPPKSLELKKLKENYSHLLTEFTKKCEEVKDLSKKLRNSCGSGGADAAEIQLLTGRIDELKDEQVEFKCLMREQSVQLEDYRNKYLTAQQKVEEQGALIEKLNMNNKRIEKQINLEIKEIRCKFQDKLRELLQLPKLLENEQLKVSRMCREKDDLESKLIVVCKELKTVKNKLQAQEEGAEDCRPQLKKCEQELDQTKKCLEEAQRQRDLFCEQLKASQEDVDCLRSESAKIIARLKERSEVIKKQQQEQICRLEKQLAQCRATACLSVSDRECVIREMQGQLNTLSYSFDAAQKQIKTLRNHIAYMSNENCFPSKC